jgi:hypothetical protein
MEPQSYYKEKIDQYTQTLDRLKRIVTTVAVGRLISFIALAFAIYKWITTPGNTWMIATLVLLIVFIVLVRMALQLNDRKAFMEKLLFINTNEQQVLNNQSNKFDSGGKFLEFENNSNDLDIFGDRSLYHLLNRTTTSHGAERLAGLLERPLLNVATIRDHQEAVKVLSTMSETRQQIAAHGLLQQEKEGSLHQLTNWLQTPDVLLHRPWVKVLSWVIPIFNITAFFVYLAIDNSLWIKAGVLISWITTAFFAKYIILQYVTIGKKQKILDQYADILQAFSTIDAGSSVVLQQLKTRAGNAFKAIRRLSQIAGYIDQLSNMFAHPVLLSFVWYDIQCMLMLEKWKKQHNKEFINWIECVSDIEMLNSLATFAFNNPKYHYPTIHDDQLAITATQLAHPLIPAHESVANDCSVGIDERLILVTGSNMSGKTTFLRTLGVNLLLAQCGAPVCAASFSCTPMVLRTSIRVSDSLQDHTSYFMAELKRLQQIIHYLQQNDTPVLILIDEILRGTNSEDKTHGSEMFIKKLLQYNCLTLFATHDLALSRLEEELPKQVSNNCFESTIHNGELLFDYKLQRGVAKNKNASFLMQKMEII